MTRHHAALKRNSLLAVILLTGIVSLLGDAEGPPGPLIVDIVQVTPEGLLLEPGDTATLTAQAFYENGAVVPNAGFTWSSTNAGVATVTARGNLATVRAVAPGTATIRATSERVIGSSLITVSQ